uniref:Uncharacterized protein n=1 Tax=Prolemur simus TaxID=1328070 RepID=A0A8C8ZUZ1_PROSS
LKWLSCCSELQSHHCTPALATERSFTVSPKKSRTFFFFLSPLHYHTEVFKGCGKSQVTGTKAALLLG